MQSQLDEAIRQRGDGQHEQQGEGGEDAPGPGQRALDAEGGDLHGLGLLLLRGSMIPREAVRQDRARGDARGLVRPGRRG